MKSNKLNIINVTEANVAEAGVYCIKDKKAPGYKAKVEWFKNKINNGLKIKIVIDENDKQLGFIEYIPSELAWRPVKAKNYLFIQCIGIFGKESRMMGIGSLLLQQCENDAIQENKSGVCCVTSDGPWLADRRLFEKNGFECAEKIERFELMYKQLNENNPVPVFIDWRKKISKYQGWNLIYSDQCPWHDKSVYELSKIADQKGIILKVRKIEKPAQAQGAPSGFGTFSLLKDGKLLEDHYLSGTRFKNILKKELVDE